MDVDYSCYEGRRVTGASEVVLSRGKVIIEGGSYVGTKGDGRFLKRSVARDQLA
jgi:dihydropyrimidinase